MKADYEKVNELYQVINAAIGKHQRKRRAPTSQVIAALRGLRKSAIAMGLITEEQAAEVEREIDLEWVVLNAKTGSAS